MEKEPGRKPIPWEELFKAILEKRNLYFLVLGVTFVISAVFALGTPNYYTSTVVLAPELSTLQGNSSSLSSLASSFGINLGNTGKGSGDAIVPILYPDLINSEAFKTSLLPVKVQSENLDSAMTYYDYLSKAQKKSLSTHIFGFVPDLINALVKSFTEKPETTDTLNPRKLTKEQNDVVNAMKEKVNCKIDKKTMVITIIVNDQDPDIAADLADSVQQHLQDFITEYRTKKARIDVEHDIKMVAETKQKYDEALTRYASFSDANQKVFLERLRTQANKYNVEMSLAQQTYSQALAQLSADEAKLQQVTPAFTTLQPATVPVKKAGPQRAKMCLIWLILSFMATTGWVLYKKKLLFS